MIRPPIRAVTIGIAERHPIEPRVVEGAADLVRRAADAYTAGGYEVQTLRLSMRSMLEDLEGSSSAEIITLCGQPSDEPELGRNFILLGWYSVSLAAGFRRETARYPRRCPDCKSFIERDRSDRMAGPRAAPGRCSIRCTHHPGTRESDGRGPGQFSIRRSRLRPARESLLSRRLSRWPSLTRDRLAGRVDRQKCC